MRQTATNAGFTLVELLVAVFSAAILLGALAAVVRTASRAHDVVSERNAVAEDASFAMDRMVRAVQRSWMLALPFADNPATDWRENVREETVPASPPEGSSTLATAVLAVAMDPALDQDADGVPDADNDGDGLIDEDRSGDIAKDFAAGLIGIDDDGDGAVDEAGLFGESDDDEGSVANEDPVDGVDNDGDLRVDEDPGGDLNGDGCPGLCGVDDDLDGTIDEGGFWEAWDDDEDGTRDEDWLDAVVFFLSGDTLVERLPVPWDETGVGGITGRDFRVHTIAERVTRFRVERIPEEDGRAVLVDLTLELSGPSGESISLNTRVRVGSGL